VNIVRVLFQIRLCFTLPVLLKLAFADTYTFGIPHALYMASFDSATRLANRPGRGDTTSLELDALFDNSTCLLRETLTRLGLGPVAQMTSFPYRALAHKRGKRSKWLLSEWNFGGKQNGSALNDRASRGNGRATRS